MDDMSLKRDHVMGLYKSEGWKAKVRKMPDAQVLAIYMREINKAKERPKPPEPKPKESGSDGDIPF